MPTPSERPAILGEEKVLGCLIRSRDFAAVAAKHLRPSYFENPIRHNIAKMATDYFKRYGSPITVAAFGAELANLVRDKKVKAEDASLYGAELKKAFDTDVSDAPYVLEQLVGFIKGREWRSLIEDAVKKHLPKGQFDEIERIAQEIGAIKTVVQQEPLDYYSDAAIDERTTRREEEALKPTAGISTGIKRMDDCFPKRGWYPKELYVILAPPKRGKTMSLLFFANMAAWQGFNVAYFSFEVSKEVCCDRLDAMNTSTELTSLGVPAHIRAVAKSLKDKKPPGKLFLFEYPTKSCTPQEVARQVEVLESKGHRVDMLLADYGDIMKPSRHYDNPLKEEASIFEDLRGIAGHFGMPVVTASQVNREGSDKEIIRGKNVAGSWEKIMVADGVISLSATEAELRDEIMKVHFAECRNMRSRTLKIKTSFGLGRFYKEFIEEVR